MPAAPHASAVASAQAAHPGRLTSLQGFDAPQLWDFDNCARREPVLDADHIPPRVVRRVGWNRCLRCRRPFFSDDVVRLRLCDGLGRCRDR